MYNNQAGYWSTICDDTFDNTNAKIACRDMGFNDGLAVPGSMFRDNLLSINVSSVSCGGQEQGLMDCIFQWGFSCQSGKYASVYCSPDQLIDEGKGNTWVLAYVYSTYDVVGSRDMYRNLNNII